jgi:tripartite ATP-independent transporter DctP family solute receptor
VKKHFATVLALLLTLTLISGFAFAGPLVIKLTHEEPADAELSSAQASALVFKDVIESQSNGQMEVKIYPASSMGNQRERMEQTKANIIQVNIASIGGLAQFFPAIDAVDLPFAIPNHAVAYKVFDGEFGKWLGQKLDEKTGFRLLCVTAGGFYVLSNNVRPIHSPADMKGIKFRTMAVPSHIAMMKAFGAAATPIPWDELYSSLQTGVVEGQHNPIPIMAIGNLQEVQKYVTLTNHLYGADWWVTSETFYKSLNDEQRRIFTNAVVAAKVAGRGSKLILGATKQGVNFLKKAGVQVYSPTAEELAQFKELAVPAVLKTMPAGSEQSEVAERLLDAVKKAEAGLYGK